jgi:LacI family transcriptional regulator
VGRGLIGVMRHVAILIETSRAYGRGLIRGIARYQREGAPGRPIFWPQGLGDLPPPWLANWRGDGILARIDNMPLAQAVSRSRLPVVNLRRTVGGRRLGERLG